MSVRVKIRLWGLFVLLGAIAAVGVVTQPALLDMDRLFTGEYAGDGDHRASFHFTWEYDRVKSGRTYNPAPRSASVFITIIIAGVPRVEDLRRTAASDTYERDESYDGHSSIIFKIHDEGRYTLRSTRCSIVVDGDDIRDEVPSATLPLECRWPRW